MAEKALAVVEPQDTGIVEEVVIKGDLSKLTPQERATYYVRVCRSVGLNPFTQPFAYVTLNGKLTLYALKGATDQLRGLHAISITETRTEYVDELLVVTVFGRDKAGRIDSEIGAVTIGGLKGEAKANALMKALTKAKRRLTLSMVGLGMLDETEIETVPSARPVPVDVQTGEIVQAGPPAATRGAEVVVEMPDAPRTLNAAPGPSQGATPPPPAPKATRGGAMNRLHALAAERTDGDAHQWLKARQAEMSPQRATESLSTWTEAMLSDFAAWIEARYPLEADDEVEIDHETGEVIGSQPALIAVSAEDFEKRIAAATGEDELAAIHADLTAARADRALWDRFGAKARAIRTAR